VTETERRPNSPVALRRPVSLWLTSVLGLAGIAGLGALTVLPEPFHVSPRSPLEWVLAVVIGLPAHGYAVSPSHYLDSARGLCLARL